VARGQGGQGGRVDGVQLAGRGDLLAVLVHQEDDLCVALRPQAGDHLADLRELLFMKDQISTRHSVVSSALPASPACQKVDGRMPARVNMGHLNAKINGPRHARAATSPQVLGRSIVSTWIPAAAARTA